MSYLEMVKADVAEWIDENRDYLDFSDYSDLDDLRDDLNDKLWIDDSVTGNASGSYTFNSEAAKEIVLENMDEVREALQEFCTPAEEIGSRFLSEDWEWLDVSARCFVLSSAIYEYTEEHAEELEKMIEEAAA